MSDEEERSRCPSSLITHHSSLARQLGRFARRRSREVPPESETVGAYEQVTRRGLEDLERVVERLEGKINAILAAVAVSVLVEVAKVLFQ